MPTPRQKKKIGRPSKKDKARNPWGGAGKPADGCLPGEKKHHQPPHPQHQPHPQPTIQCASDHRRPPSKSGVVAAVAADTMMLGSSSSLMAEEERVQQQGYRVVNFGGIVLHVLNKAE